jgi:hypothetical protein
MGDGCRILIIIFIYSLIYNIHCYRVERFNNVEVDSLSRIIERRDIIYNELKKELVIKEDSIKTINNFKRTSQITI